jgi:hypothetical protein
VECAEGGVEYNLDVYNFNKELIFFIALCLVFPDVLGTIYRFGFKYYETPT